MECQVPQVLQDLQVLSQALEHLDLQVQLELEFQELLEPRVQLVVLVLVLRLTIQLCLDK